MTSSYFAPRLIRRNSILALCTNRSTTIIAPENVSLLFATNSAALHDFAGHAESAARIPAIMTILEQQGLTSMDTIQQIVNNQPARIEDIVAVHKRSYIEALARICGNVSPAGEVVDTAPTYVTPTTYQDALYASGAVVNLVDSVIATSNARENTGKAAPVGFGICRPPGHHAIPQGAMGFCIFNTVAVAIRHAMKHHKMTRIVLFDWDVHHGNGSNDYFYDDSDVLFISTHQSNAYPNTGKISEVGRGDGEGYSINLPLPGDCGHEGLLAVFTEVVEPAIRRHKPDMIFVSAGFDAHWRDPLAGLQARTSTFHALAERMSALSRELCGGKMVMVLEGGYDLKALGESVANTFLALVGEPHTDVFNPALLRDEPLDKVRSVIMEAQKLHGL